MIRWYSTGAAIDEAGGVLYVRGVFEVVPGEIAPFTKANIKKYVLKEFEKKLDEILVDVTLRKKKKTKGDTTL